MLLRDVVQEWAIELFTPFASFNLPGQMRPFHYKNLPPQVNISIVYSCLFLSFVITEQWTDSLMQRSTRRIGRCTF